MKRQLVSIVLILAVLLSACAPGNPQPTAAPTMVPTTPPTAEPTPSVEMTPTAAATDVSGEPASADAVKQAAEQADQIAQLNPPPALSNRELGATTVPCELGAPRGPQEVEGQTYFCGIFTVPMRWDQPDGPRIDLRYIVVKATGPKAAPDPILFLAGGPGQSATLTGLTAYDQLRSTHDIIRLDQRGTGQSARLSLEECLVLALRDEQALDRVQVLIDYINSGASEADQPSAAQAGTGDFNAQVQALCAKEFARAGMDLEAFTTDESARDVIGLVQALGYDSFNLHGVSYGTRLAMTIMALLPQVTDPPTLRSVVLDSTLPPSVNLLSALIHKDHDQIVQLLADCAASETCRTAYPNLPERLGALLTQLEAQPLTIAGETITLTDLVKVLSDLTNTRAGYMPLMIAELEKGKADTYLALRDQTLGVEPAEALPGLDLNDPIQVFMSNATAVVVTGDDFGPAAQLLADLTKALATDDPYAAVQTLINQNYQGETLNKLKELLAALSPADFAQFINVNIHCIEDYQFESVADWQKAAAELAFPQFADLDYVQAQAATCASWPVDAAPIEIKRPISSTVPTLILQGAYDTRTPVYLGQLAANELTNSTFVLVPQQGHEVWTAAQNCAGRIATAFVLDPTQKLDLTCLAERRPQWALPADGTKGNQN